MNIQGSMDAKFSHRISMYPKQLVLMFGFVYCEN